MTNKRGKYKIENVFENPRYNEVLLLLMSGYSTRKKLEQMKINASTWENKYKPKLLKEEVIGENSERKPYTYTFNWDKLFNDFRKHVEDVMSKKRNEDSDFDLNIDNELRRLNINQSKIQWYKETIEYAKKKYKTKKDNFEYGYSYEFRVFLINCLKNYIKYTPLSRLLKHNLTFHYNDIINSFILNKSTILEMARFFKSANLQKDIVEFCLTCEQIKFGYFSDNWLHLTLLAELKGTSKGKVITKNMKEHFVNEVMPQA